MKIKLLVCFILLTVNTITYAMPKVLVKHQRNAKNLIEVRVINQTMKKLVCSVGIDGRKIYFRLGASQPSKWYVATDERFNYTNVSTWCDYLSLHPKYQQKNN